MTSRPKVEQKELKECGYFLTENCTVGGSEDERNENNFFLSICRLKIQKANRKNGKS